MNGLNLCVAVFEISLMELLIFYFSVGYNKAYDKLVSARPEGSLVKPSNILSILLQVLCAAVFQTAAFLYLRGQSWYAHFLLYC